MKYERGASVLELTVVIAIFATLFGIITVNLFNAGARVSLQSSLTTLLSDIRQQQARAMTVDTNGTNAAKEFGIYFSQNSYTLFIGSSYSATSSANFVIPLGNSITFSSISLPNQSVVFSRQSGEIVGFNNSQNTVTLKN